MAGRARKAARERRSELMVIVVVKYNGFAVVLKLNPKLSSKSGTTWREVDYAALA